MPADAADKDFPVVTRSLLDALSCGGRDCKCEDVHFSCRVCGGDDFLVGYRKAAGVLFFRCTDCLSGQSVRVAGEG